MAKSDQLERRVATTMLAVTADRIFSEGKNATGAAIGDYSAGYMRQRQRMNYPASTKVILQATRQMVNDWSVISDGSSLGLGFKNKTNAEKSEWVEQTYGQAIFKHTKQERKLLNDLMAKEINRWLKGA